MFRLDHLKKLFQLLDETEKGNPGFSPEEKTALYRMAFYRESFDEIRNAVLQAAAFKPGEEERRNLLRQCTQSLPELPGRDAVQMEQYIFQLQQMCYEQDKGMELLEQILKPKENMKEPEAMSAAGQEHPTEKEKRGRIMNGRAR